MTVRGVVAILAVLAAAGAIDAQRVQVAVVPEAITVGDVFHAAIRLDLPSGGDVIAPDSLALPPDIETAGRRDLRTDTAGGGHRITLVYPLAAWRPGTYAIPPVSIRLLTRDGEQSLTAELPEFTVQSVLPADTAGIEMRPERDVFGASRLWWPWVLAGLLAMAAAIAFAVWRRRHRPDEAPAIVAPARPAREIALERLEALRGSGLLERGDARAFYAGLAETMRHFAATVDSSWSVDLTTGELHQRIRARLRDPGVLELIRVLSAADMAKFARARPDPEAGFADLDAARAWIERMSPPEPEPEPGDAEARSAA